MKGTYQKNRTAVVALAALAWLGVLSQLYASAIGYQRTMTNAVGLLMAFMMLGMILVALGRIQRRANA
jgi:hypothetical protein